MDWWAFGVLIYQMLLQQSPFRGEDEDEIYDAILADEPLYPIHMPRDSVSILQKLLTREPEQRLGSGPTDAQEIMNQPFFRNIVWDDIYHKRVAPPFLPQIKNATDTSNFDSEFTSVTPVLTPVQSGMSIYSRDTLPWVELTIRSSAVPSHAGGVPRLLVHSRLRLKKAERPRMRRGIGCVYASRDAIAQTISVESSASVAIERAQMACAELSGAALQARVLEPPPLRQTAVIARRLDVLEGSGLTKVIRCFGLSRVAHHVKRDKRSKKVERSWVPPLTIFFCVMRAGEGSKESREGE